MKPVLLFGVVSLAALIPAQAGSVMTQGGNETTGKVTINGSNIEVTTGSSPTDVNFSEVLEADFSDTPFQMNFFSSATWKGKQLPPGWKDLDIGETDSPGSSAVDDGTFFVNGSSTFAKQRKYGEEHIHFTGVQWPGDGQWVVQIKEVDANATTTMGGLMLRGSLDANAQMAGVETAGLGNGNYVERQKADGPGRPTQISLTPPGWMKLIRFGPKVYAYVSADQQVWDLVGQGAMDGTDAPFIGLTAHTHRDKEPGKVTFTDLKFGPAPSSAALLPPGAILVGGSFVAGACDRMSLGKDAAQGAATMDRNGLALTIPAPNIAAITMSPVTHSQLNELMTHLGLVMKNGDMMDGDLDSITKGGSVIVNSIIMGTTVYPPTNIRGCVFRPIAPQPSKYEIRLTDGSIIEASDITAAGGGIKITDVSTTMIYARTEEIAQIRAGTSTETPLAELAWKASTQGAAAPAKPAANAAPAIAPAPPPPDQGPEVGAWRGPNQEEVLAADASTVIDFPLKDHIHAVALKVAIASDSPQNGQASVRILADGREIGRTQIVHTGDAPRFLQSPVQDAQKITFIADSLIPGTRILYIDPVGLK